MIEASIEASSGASAAQSRNDRQHFPAAIEREQQQAAEDGRDRMERELEARDDPEVAAASAQTPQQPGPLGLTDGHDVAVGRHDVSADQVVARQSVLALQPADPAAQREAGDAGGRDQAAGRRESVSRGRGIEVGPGRTGLDRGRAPVDVDFDVAHR